MIEINRIRVEEIRFRKKKSLFFRKSAKQNVRLVFDIIVFNIDFFYRIFYWWHLDVFSLEFPILKVIIDERTITHPFYTERIRTCQFAVFRKYFLQKRMF